MAFSKESTFSKDNNFSLVKIGERKPVLETELNEMQEIQNQKRKEVVKLLLADGVFKSANITFTGGNFTISNTSVVLSGEILTISSLTIPAVNGDSIYVDMWEEEVSYLDVIKKGGNQQSTDVVTNKLFDSRANIETARRVQVKYTLSKTNTDPIHQYLKLGRIENNAFVQEVKIVSSSDDLLETINALNEKAPEWDSKETPAGAQAKATTAKTEAIASAKTYTDTEVGKKVDKVAGKQLSTEDYTTAEKNKLAGVEAGATKYVHPATHPATMITQDANNRMVTDAQITDWTAKETPSEAQTKANTAETNAINFAKSFGLGVSAVAIPNNDPNNLTTTGFYIIDANSINVPFSFGSLLHTRRNNDATQLAIETGSGASVYFRRKSSAGTWSAWTQLATQDWVKSFGIGGQAKTISNTDLNSLDETGFYYGTNLTNSPNTTHHYYVNNIKLGSTDRHQVLYRNSVGAYKEVYFRIQNAGTWTAWLQLETTADSQAKATTAETNAINFAKSFGLGTTAKDIANTNLNTLTETGFYRGNNMGNAPSTGYFNIIHIHISTGYARQIAISYGSASTMHTRYCDNGAWTSWVQYETTTGAQAKADAVNSVQVNKLADDSRDNATLITGFPEGVTVMRANASGKGFPYQWGTLMTVRTTTFGCQTLYGTDNKIYTRMWYPTDSVWRAWEQQETSSGAQAKADAVNTTQVNKIADNSKTNADALTAYTEGVTVMKASIAGRGFPFQWGTLTTIRTSEYGMQLFSFDTGAIFSRVWNPNGQSWREWVQQETTASAQAKIDNLQIGGRNYLQNGDISQGMSKWRDWGTATGASRQIVDIDDLGTFKKAFQFVSPNGNGQWGYAQDAIKVLANTVYTLSCMFKSSDATKVYIQKGNGGTEPWSGAVAKAEQINGKWQKLSYTWKTGSVDSLINAYFGLDGNGGTGTVLMTGFKLEQGDKATEWFPSPEELETIAGSQAKANTAEANAKKYVDDNFKQKHPLTQNTGTAITATGDWNNYKTTGFYMGQSLANAPDLKTGDNNWWYVQVIQHNVSWCVQIAWNFNDSKRTMSRSLVNGVWTKWENAGGGGGSVVRSLVVDTGVSIVKGDPVAINQETGKLKKAISEQHRLHTGASKSYSVNNTQVRRSLITSGGYSIVATQPVSAPLYITYNVSKLTPNNTFKRTATTETTTTPTNNWSSWHMFEIDDNRFGVFAHLGGVDLNILIFSINPTTLELTLDCKYVFKDTISIDTLLYCGITYMGNNNFVITLPYSKVIRLLRYNPTTKVMTQISSQSYTSAYATFYNAHCKRLTDDKLAFFYNANGENTGLVSVNLTTGVFTFGTTYKIYSGSGYGGAIYYLKRLSDNKILWNNDRCITYNLSNNTVTRAEQVAQNISGINNTIELVPIPHLTDSFLVIGSYSDNNNIISALTVMKSDGTIDTTVPIAISEAYCPPGISTITNGFSEPRPEIRLRIVEGTNVLHAMGTNNNMNAVISHTSFAITGEYASTYGIALANGNAGATIDVALSGIVEGLSDLVTGSYYSSYRGTGLKQTIGDEVNVLGLAVSDTELLIK